jgi:adenylate cyclase
LEFAPKANSKHALNTNPCNLKLRVFSLGRFYEYLLILIFLNKKSKRSKEKLGNRSLYKKTSAPNLSTALKIALIWTAIAGLQALYEYAVLQYWAIQPEMDSYWVLVQSTILIVFIAGILVGWLLIPRVNLWLRTHSYGLALLMLVASTTLLFFTMSTIGSFIYNAIYFKLNIFDPSIPPIVWDYLFGIENIKNYFFWLFIAVFTILGIQINDKYGPGIFTSFILGRYFHPKAEERIFMFLDLRSSTEIAEQLDELEYFEFLKEFFKDATTGILKAKGEIYQYVGDEIVISWPFLRGLENRNCINAYFEVKKIIEREAEKYKSKYGVVPSFKVGLHGGKVISGEIGLIKRDIAFSGDILNTAARIQAKCNELGVDLLLSQDLYDRLRMPSSQYVARSVGNVDLRGKSEPLTLYTIDLQ